MPNRRIENFVWIAVFDDKSELRQYPEGTRIEDFAEETNFREVLNRQDHLNVFKLASDDGKTVSVNLKTGEFQIDGITEKPYTPSGALLRPINIRRIKRVVDQFGQEIHMELTHILGWQTTFEGKNYQATISINPSGKIELSW